MVRVSGEGELGADFSSIEPPVFKDGHTLTFDAWKRAVRNKLRSNADHYPTEEAKLGYVLSRVEQPASDILEPYER
jgi:hypothetical protein